LRQTTLDYEMIGGALSELMTSQTVSHFIDWGYWWFGSDGIIRVI
jgi:hypothetical protein